MPIIQMLFTRAGTFRSSSFNTTANIKPAVTVIPTVANSAVGIDPLVSPFINVEMWGGGGASGSTIYGDSGNGGAGGYISANIPSGQLALSGLNLTVGGGGGNPTYYTRPLDEYLEFNAAQVQYINSVSSSSDATYSTITPVAGASVSSVSNATYSTISQVTSASSSSDTTYSTITPVPGASVSSVSNATYSTVTPVAGASVSSVSSPTYNTVTHVASVSDTGVTSLTIPAGTLQVGDVILVASVCATGTTPQNNPNTPTGGYTVLQNATVTANVNYKLSYRRVTDANIDSLIDGLSDITTDNNGNDLIVAHTASIFRNVIGVGDPITSLFTSTATSTSINPPSIVTETPNYMSVAFGFHNDRSITPTGIPAGYTQTVVQAVGTNAAANNEATIMAAHRNLTTSTTEDPGVFTVPDPENYVAVTVGLMPTRTLSTITGTITLSGLQENDIVLVSSVSDGGTMNLPTGFTNISSATGSATSPAYRVSWRRITAADLLAVPGSYTISTLSLSGTISGGAAAGQLAGVAHYATAFRGASTTANPIFTTSTGTGNPDSPSITATTSNHTILSFGFLDNRSLPTLTLPTGYTSLTNGVNTVGNDATGTTEATSMVAYRNLTTTITENPAAFNVTGSAGANYAAVTVALSPIRTLSTITGSMTLSGLQVNDIVLVSSVSDGGTMNTPTAPTGAFGIISSSTGTSPAYRVSWKRITAADLSVDSLLISTLSLSGTTTGGLAAGVAHYATAFRGTDPTALTPFITGTSTGTGNPDSPSITATTSNYTSVSFGFLNDTGFPTVTAPTSYTQLSSLAISDNTPGTEATSMVAYRNLTTTITENPAAFNVAGVGGENYAAVTVGLIPIRTSSPITGTITLSGLQENDIVLVSSVSDGGTMNLPNAPTGAFSNISNAIGSATSPAYRVSWRRVVAGDLSVGSLTISNLSLSGTVVGGSAAGDPAGVAHYATAFRGASTTANPIFTAASTGTGNPNSLPINVTTSNHTILSFGFLNDTGFLTVAAPTSYTQLSTLRVSDNTPGTEATSMVAYRNLTTEVTTDPGAFNVTGIGGEDYAAVTVALSPIRTLSTITGSMTLSGLVDGDIVLVSSVSDGGTMNLPTGFTNISSATGSATSPAYRVSWRRVVAGDLSVGSLTISNLSLSGTVVGGSAAGLTAGVAHYATAFRGTDPTALTPFITGTSTGTGNPNSPSINPLPTANYTSVSFGFLNNNGFPTVAAPTSYTQLSSLAISDNTPETEATSMVAYRASLPSGVAGEDPGAFNVTGVGGENYAAVTVGLRPYLLPSATDLSILNLPGGIQQNDIILVASVSDGGVLSTPLGYTSLASQTGTNTPSYQVSWKRVSATIDTQITQLSIAGQIDGGISNGSIAGIAHVASIYRGVSSTTNPTVSTNNGTGSPDPAQITGLAAGAVVVPFGFLDNRSILDGNITAPTQYTKTITRAVGQDNNGEDEATVMSAFREVTAGGTENPGPFGVTNAAGQPYSVVTAVLIPQVIAKFSTATGGCGGSGGGYSGIFLFDGTPLLIAAGGGGGGGGTANNFISAKGGDGGPNGLPGSNGNVNVLDPITVTYRPAGGGGGAGTVAAGGAGGLTLSGPAASPISGNPGEIGAFYNANAVGGFFVGGRGANSPHTDLTSLPLYGANATGGWNRGPGGGSFRTDLLYTSTSIPTDCGGGGGAGYYGGGGGGAGNGGGGGGGGGGFNYVDPRVNVNVNASGIGTVPLGTNSLNYIPGIGYGGSFVSGSGVPVVGNPGGDGLILISYFE